MSIFNCFVDVMSSLHNSLVLLKRQVSLANPYWLVEREAEYEREVEVVRELKESLSSWEELGFYFHDMDSEILTEELRDLRESAIQDGEEALNIIQLLKEGSFKDLCRIRQRGKELAVRLLEYYPRAIHREEALLSKSWWIRKVVKCLLRDDTLDRLSHSTAMGDEASLLKEVLKELLEQLEEQSPRKVSEMCSLLEEVEWGTHFVTTIDVDECDALYDYLMSIFERAEGYDFYTRTWTGHRDQTMDEAQSKLEDLARKARQALIKLLEEWERDHELRGEKGGRR